MFALFYGNNSIEGCNKYSGSDCGTGSTWTLSCAGKSCGNVENAPVTMVVFHTKEHNKAIHGMVELNWRTVPMP